MQSFQETDYTKRFDLSLWKKLLHIAKPYHKNLYIVAAFMSVSAILDVLFPMMTSYAIDNFITGQTMQGIPAFIGVYLAMLAFQVISIFVFLRQSGYVETGTCYTIRKLGFQKLQELPFSYYDRMPVGYLMSRLTNDTQRLADTIGWSLLDLCWGAVFLVCCSIQMFLLNWRLALVVILVLPPLAVISWKFQKSILASYRKVRKTNSQITAGFNEGINGAKTTKTLVREEMNIQEFNEVAGEMRRSSVRAATLSSLFLPIVVSLGSLATAYALWKGGQDVLIGAMTLGTVNVFVSYTVQFFQPVRDIARIFAELQSSQAAAERVISLLETEPDIVDTPEVVAEFGDNFHPKRENWPKLHGEVEFSDVGFRYKERASSVLAHFNLHRARPAQTIALVGETGSGQEHHCEPGVPVLRAHRGLRAALTGPITAPAASTGCTRRWAMCCKRRTCSAAPLPITSALRGPTPPRTWCAVRRRWSTPRASSSRWTRAITAARSAKAAIVFPPARSS